MFVLVGIGSKSFRLNALIINTVTTVFLITIGYLKL